jgi:uncharacterized protein (DUF1501 family)
MKTILLPGVDQTCDGVSRRSFMKIGALSFLGLTLPDFLRMRAAAAAPGEAKAEACILLWLGGGPSHLDTFDPKPDAPADVRGEFKAIDTNVTGIQVCEHLPQTAKVMDKFAIVRSLTSSIAAHEQASQYMLTGYKPLPTLEYPSYGAVVAKELGVRNNLPPYVAIPDIARAGQSGFIGNAYNAFTVGDPSRPNFRVQNVNLPREVDSTRLAKRRAFVERANRRFEQELPDDSVRAVDSFYERAYDLVSSTDAKKAFDVNAEDSKTRDLYGMTSMGQGCLLSRRLVEAGARFITISKGGWDTHQQNFQRLATGRNALLPELDQAYAGLLTDLAQRGMLQKTLVLMMGEFGRTPRVNARGGRDHWPRARFICMAGGGIRGGQVVGKTDPTGSQPAERPVSVEDVAATLYTCLGIDVQKVYRTPTGRPIHIAQEGQVIKELFG